MLLTEISYQVMNDILDGNVFSVECGKGITGRPIPTLYITTREKVDYTDFLNKTRGMITEDNISCSEDFSISIELTNRIIKEIMEYANCLCNREYQQLKSL